MPIVGRINDDFTFETCEKRTSDDVRKERVICIILTSVRPFFMWNQSSFEIVLKFSDEIKCY